MWLVYRTGVNIITYGKVSGVPLNIFSSVLYTVYVTLTFDSNAILAIIVRSTSVKIQEEIMLRAVGQLLSIFDTAF